MHNGVLHDTNTRSIARTIRLCGRISSITDMPHTPANLCPLRRDAANGVRRLADDTLSHHLMPKCKADAGGPPLLFNQAVGPPSMASFERKKNDALPGRAEATVLEHWSV